MSPDGTESMLLYEQTFKRIQSLSIEKEWAKYGTLDYTTEKSGECRDGIILEIA